MPNDPLITTPEHDTLLHAILTTWRWEPPVFPNAPYWRLTPDGALFTHLVTDLPSVALTMAQSTPCTPIQTPELGATPLLALGLGPLLALVFGRWLRRCLMNTPITRKGP